MGWGGGGRVCGVVVGVVVTDLAWLRAESTWQSRICHLVTRPAPKSRGIFFFPTVDAFYAELG
jgi:hypothetical protein